MEPTLYSDSLYGGIFSGAWGFFWLLILIAFIVAGWKIFTKAGRAGWASLIPIYNIYVMLKISNMSGWWLLAFFFPILNLIASIMLGVNLAHAFGKSTAYGVFLLWLISPIGMLMLGFGSAEYQGVAEAAPVPATPATPPAKT